MKAGKSNSEFRLSLLALLLSVAAGCGKPPQPPTTSERLPEPSPAEATKNDIKALSPIKIGVAGPMTGSAAAFGEMIRNAALLKVKEVNGAGGINDLLVKLVIEDDRGNTLEATNVARKLAGDEQISIIIGHFNSTCSIAARDTYNRKGVVEFSPGSTNVTVCKGSEWTFRNLYRDDYQGTFLAHYAKKKLGVTKVAVFYDNDDYGKGLMKSFVDEAKNIGLEVVASESYIRERDQDFKAPLTKIKALEPDAIFISGLYNEAALITKAAKIDLGMTVTILGADGVMSPGFVDVGGEATNGTFVTTPFLFTSGSDSDEAKKFFSAFKEAYGKEPDTWAALTYDAIGMAIEAIREVGPDRKKIKDWFAACTSEEKAYTGVTGKTYFNEDGDCYSKPAHVAIVTNGKFVPAEKQLSPEEMK